MEAKHTIDMVRFVDEVEIDSRYYEKPYYLLPDGDAADEASIIRDALKTDPQDRCRADDNARARAPCRRQSTGSRPGATSKA